MVLKQPIGCLEKTEKRGANKPGNIGNREGPPSIDCLPGHFKPSFSSYHPFEHKNSSNAGDENSVSKNVARESLGKLKLSEKNGSAQKSALVSESSDDVVLSSAIIFVLQATAVLSLVMDDNSLEDGCGDDGTVSIIREVIGFDRELFCSISLFCLFSRWETMLLDLHFSSYKPYRRTNSSNAGDKHSVSGDGARKSHGM